MLHYNNSPCKHNNLSLLLSTLLLLASQTFVSAEESMSHAQTHSNSAEKQLPSSVVAAQRSEPFCQKLHEQCVARAKEGNIDILFLGDSITEGMNRKLMHKIIGEKAENFGVGGDRTQNLIWRLRNGELDIKGSTPRAIVVLIGTNNTVSWGDNKSNTSPEIVLGVKEVLKEIRERQANAKILLLGLLPRDEKPGTHLRKEILEINKELQKLADNKHVWYADIGDKLLEPDGKISTVVMSDFLHPTEDLGYQKMFDAIKPHLDVVLSAH